MANTLLSGGGFVPGAQCPQPENRQDGLEVGTTHPGLTDILVLKPPFSTLNSVLIGTLYSHPLPRGLLLSKCANDFLLFHNF